MKTVVFGMPVAFMAMLAAIVGIRIAKAYLRRPAQAQRHIEDGHGANRRLSEFSQCTHHCHGAKIYQIPSRRVKQPDRQRPGRDSVNVPTNGSTANRIPESLDPHTF